MTWRPLGQELDVRAEHLHRPEAAVQQDQRLALAEDLVAELDPVDAHEIRFGLHQEVPFAWQ